MKRLAIVILLGIFSSGACATGLGGLLKTLQGAVDQTQQGNQIGGTSGSGLLKSLTGATSSGGGTTSLSGMMSGGSDMAEFTAKLYEKFPRGPATRYSGGKSLTEESITEPFLSPSHPTVAYIQKVLTVITMHSRRPITYAGRYAVFVIEDPDQANMFAAPGGFVLVTRKFLDLIENEDQLAFWLAHEVAHVELDHNYTKISDNAAKKMYEEQTGIDVDSLYTDGLKDEWNAEFETEADLRGIEIMWQAGYDPFQALAAIKKIGKELGSAEGYRDSKQRHSLARAHAKELPYKGSKQAFEFREKRFGQSLRQGVQTASSSVTSGTKKKKSKSSVGDDK